MIDESYVSPPPMLSVILPTFNRKSLVTRAIDSILSQSYEDFELIIVDDGSTDGTIHVLEQYNDPRIRILQKENGGVSSARNLGLDHAQGKYITFVDSDDYLLQGFFEDAWEFLSNNQVSGVFYGGLAISAIKSKEFPVFFEKKIDVLCYENYELFKDFCLFGGNSWACAKFFDRDLINKHQVRFCEDIIYGEDLNFILQFLLVAPNVGVKNSKFYCCDVRHESINRGGVDMDVQSENLLRNHYRIEALLKLHQREDWMYCLNSLTIAHVSSRYFKKVKRWRSKPSAWESDFRKICADTNQEVNFYREIRNKCLALEPPMFWAWFFYFFNKCIFIFTVIFKIKIMIFKKRRK